MNAIEPLSFWLLDGREAKFLLRFRHIRQAATEAAGSADNAAAFGTEVLARMLFSAMVDKSELTFDQFDELLPPDPDLLRGFYEALQKHCIGAPQNEKYRPQKSQAPNYL